MRALAFTSRDLLRSDVPARFSENCGIRLIHLPSRGGPLPDLPSAMVRLQMGREGVKLAQAERTADQGFCFGATNGFASVVFFEFFS